MGKDSKIQWTDHTFNPWRGCTKVAPGCANCYADALAKRFPNTHGIWGPNGQRVVAAESMWREPIKWNNQSTCGSPDCQNRVLHRTGTGGAHGGCPVPCPECPKHRPRVFCASLADVFEEWEGDLYDNQGCRLWIREAGGNDMEAQAMEGRTDAIFYEEGFRPYRMADVRARLFRLIDATPNLDWLLVTKRPENVRRMWPSYETNAREGARDYRPGELGGLRLDNVWLLTSVACQADVDKNIPALLQCRDLVPVLGVSAEPLIEEIDLGLSTAVCDCCKRIPTRWISLPKEVRGDFPVGHMTAAEPGIHMANMNPHGAVVVTATNGKNLGIKPGEFVPLGPIDWVIVGGESGASARPCDVEWIQFVLRQCEVGGVPCFVKQLGACPVATPVPGYTTGLASLKDKKGGDPAEWPEDLRVREFPRVK